MARRSDHTREQIRAMALQATRDLIARHGLAGVSARKIAAAIGYTVGTLYLVFRNQDDLIEHANADTLDDLYRRLAAIDLDTDPRQGLRDLAREYTRFAVDNHQRWHAVFDHSPSGQQALPDWYSAQVDRLFALPQRALQALAPRRDPAQVTLAARALWAGVHGVVVLSLKNKLALGEQRAGAQSAPALVDSLLSNYLAGYCAPPAHGAGKAPS